MPTKSITRRTSNYAGKTGFYVLIALFVLVMLFPLAYTVSLSFMNEADVESFPVRLLPSSLSFKNYLVAYTTQPIMLYLKNSLVISMITIFLNVTLALMSAYALVRTDIVGKKIFLTFMLAITLLPFTVIIQSVFELFSKMKLLNTYLGVAVLISVMEAPLSIWFMTALLNQIPVDFEESAEIEGAGLFRIMIQIYLPLLKAGIGSLSILAFMKSWNAFVIPQIVNMAKSRRTLTVGLTMYQTDFDIPYGIIAAASVTTILPVIIMVLIFQRRIIDGVLKGGVKG